MSASRPPAARSTVRYSQNFLRDPRLVASLLDTLPIARDSLIYEVGPGKGALTEQLARRFRRVVAVEVDPRLARRLRQTFADQPHVVIYQGDFLRQRLPDEPYTVVANIPFNITSAIVTKLTSAPRPPEDAYLAMQREAAATLLGQPRENLRALLLKPWYAMEVVHHFQRADFTPAPRVDVVMLRLRKRGPPLIANAQRRAYRDFVAHTFTAWRPTVEDTLARLCTRRQLSALGRTLDFEMQVPPTALTFEQWLTLFARFTDAADERARRAIAGSERRLLQRQGALQKDHRTRARTGRNRQT